MMLRPRVTVGNLQQIVREYGENGTKKGGIKRQFAMLLVEDPECASVVKNIAINARKLLEEKGGISGEEIHTLIIDTCMILLRLRELAEEGAETAKTLTSTLMTDPDTSTLDPDALCALVVSRLVLGRHRLQKKD